MKLTQFQKECFEKNTMRMINAYGDKTLAQRTHEALLKKYNVSSIDDLPLKWHELVNEMFDLAEPEVQILQKNGWR